MHIDVYKSNIHYSPIEKLIFFAQDNMPIVVGGGIAAVLMITGGIAVVCIRRKKRAAAQTSIAGTAPKPKKHKGSPSQSCPSSRSHLLPRNSAATVAPRSYQKPSSAPNAVIRLNSI